MKESTVPPHCQCIIKTPSYYARCMADKLDVPLNYFFCEDDSAAELACLIDKLLEDEKILISKLLDNIQDCLTN